MELSNVFGGDTLKAADLQGHEPVVVIASVELKKFDGGNKLIITFQGKKKALVCNKTNANRIAFLYGTNTDGWIGREVKLGTDLVDFQGKTVEAIRIRPVPRRDPASSEQNGNYTIKPIGGGGQLMEHNRSGERVPGSAATPVDLDQEVPF